MMLVKRPRNASILRNRTLTRKNCLPARESVDSPSRVIEMEDNGGCLEKRDRERERVIAARDRLLEIRGKTKGVRRDAR